jgi:hypothetical protein
MRNMMPAELGGAQAELHTINEYVYADQGCRSLLGRVSGRQGAAMCGRMCHAQGVPHPINNPVII